jgi:hypothetical protein
MLSFRGTPPSQFHMGYQKTYFITFNNPELATTIQNNIPGAHALSTTR